MLGVALTTTWFVMAVCDPRASQDCHAMASMPVYHTFDQCETEAEKLRQTWKKEMNRDLPAPVTCWKVVGEKPD